MEPTSVQFQLAQAVEKHFETGDRATVFTEAHEFALSKAKLGGANTSTFLDGTASGGHRVIIDVARIVAVRLDGPPPTPFFG